MGLRRWHAGNSLLEFTGRSITSVAARHPLRDGDCHRRRRHCSVTTVVVTVHLPLTANRPAVSGNLAIEDRATGSDRLWVVNQDNDSVSVFETATNTRVAEIAVGTAPRSLAIAPNGEIWVTNRQSSNDQRDRSGKPGGRPHHRTAIRLATIRNRGVADGRFHVRRAGSSRTPAQDRSGQ